MKYRKACDFCGVERPRKGHEAKCVERLRRAIQPKRKSAPLVDEIHQFNAALETRVQRHAVPTGLNETRPNNLCAHCGAENPAYGHTHSCPGIKAMMTDIRLLGSLNSQGEKLRQEFKAKFPAANDSCPHCQAHVNSIKHADGCPNGLPRETRQHHETHVPEENMPAVHWRAIYYINIDENHKHWGLWVLRGALDRGDRSEYSLEIEGWVRADGRFVSSTIEFKIPTRVPDLFPRFLPKDPQYIEGANNALPIYWGGHS
jgi:hypothetical protein